LDPAIVRVPQDHVVLDAAREIAEAHDLPIQSHRPQERGVGDEIVADVVDFKAARAGAAQQHVGGVATEEAAETNKLPVRPDQTQLKGSEQRSMLRRSSSAFQLRPTSLVTLRRLLAMRSPSKPPA